MPTRIAKYSSSAGFLDHCHSNRQLQPVVLCAPINTGAGYAGVRVGGIGVSVGVSPVVEYEYVVSSADVGDNYNRLCRMVYPSHDRDGRNISLFYGDAVDDVDDVLCRVTGVSDSVFDSK